MNTWLTDSIHNLVRPSADSSGITELADRAVTKQLGRTATVASICGVLAGTHEAQLRQARQFQDALTILRNLDRSRAAALVLHPSFNFWLNGLQHLLVDRQVGNALAWSSNLADFIWPESHTVEGAAPPWRTALDDRGGLRCPRYKCFIEFGVQHRGAAVEIVGNAQNVSIAVQGGRKVVLRREGHVVACEDSEPSINLLPTIHDGAMECSSRDPALRVLWREKLDRVNAIDMFGVAEDEYPQNANVAAYEATMRSVACVWPEASREIPILTRVIVPMDSGPEQRMAATLPSRNGAVFADLDDPVLMEEGLLHEYGHIKLRYLQYFDPLMINFADDATRYTVPWRKDARPIGGIFEGVFVYSYVAEYAQRRAAALGGGSVRAEKFARWVRGGVDILRQHGQFTPTGLRYLECLEEWMHSLPGATAVH